MKVAFFVCESRPRLGSVNIFMKFRDVIHQNDRNFRVELLKDDRIRIFNGKDDDVDGTLLIAEFKLKCGEKIRPGSVSGLESSDDADLIFRIRTESSSSMKSNGSLSLSNFELLPAVQKSVESSFEAPQWPFFDPDLKIPDKNVVVDCAKCKKTLIEMELERLLPLPSMNWTDSAMDWFCGCCRQVKSDQDEKEDKEIKKHTQLQKIDKLKSEKSSDLLYGPGFVWIKGSPDEKSEKNKTVNCPNCCYESGMRLHDGYVQYWSHSLFIKSPSAKRENTSTIEDTFMSLIKGCLDESSTLAAKISLKDVETKNYLFLWILERNLEIQIDQNEPRNVMKVLFATSKDLSADELKEWISMDQNVTSISVTKSIIDIGLKIMNKSRKYIPKIHSNSGNYLIGYLF